MMEKMLFTFDELCLLFDAVDEAQDKARMLSQQERYYRYDDLLSRIEYAVGRAEAREYERGEEK